MVWLNLTAGVCRDMYQPIRGLIKAQWPIRSLIRRQQGPQLIINYRDVRHSASFTCPLQHAIVLLSHYTISRPLNSYSGKLVVQSQTFYDLRTNIPVLSWSFDIRVLNGLQIALSNSGYKLLSDSLSLLSWVGGELEATFHLMGRSVIIWIPLYCHLKWGFVCFLSAQDVLAETRSDKSVMGTKRENVRWLADVSSVLRHWHKDTIGKS